MKIERGHAHSTYPYVTVHVEPGELLCDGGRRYPHGTIIGVIRLDTFRFNRWSPVGYQPRGYVPAAKRVLYAISDRLKESADRFHSEGAIDPDDAAWFAHALEGVTP